MQRSERERGRRGAISRGLMLALAVVAAGGVLAWMGISSRARAMTTLTHETAEMSVPTVQVAAPKRGGREEEFVLPGTMLPYLEAPIYARTNGYLRRRFVDMGTRVRTGQLLAEIDAPELEQQLQQARADLATAEATLRLARITANRYGDLVKSDSVSQQDADNATGTLDARQAGVESARHNVQRLEQLKAFTRIYAPFDGVITARNTEIGALIDLGAAGGVSRELFHIASTNRLRVFVCVPESISRVASRGLAADLTLKEFPGRRFTGTLVRTAEAIDVPSRTLLAEFEVDNRTGELLPGAFAQVHLKLPTPSSTCVVPVNAMMFRSDGPHVAVVRGSTVAMATVTIGRDFGTELEITNGLRGDEELVLNPPDSLVDGQQVRVLEAAGHDARGVAR